MQQRPRRVFAYTRVSSDEQERSGTSLPAQRAELIAYCERRGWPAPTVIAEVESGGAEKLEERVELQRLLAGVTAGDAVIVAKVDRWSRDLPHAVASVRDLVARGVGWFSAGENIDASDPQGDNVLGMMAWSADAERKRLKERTLGARRRMRDQGCWTEGVAPFGYRRDPVTKHLTIVPADAAHVREMFAACCAKVGVHSIGGIVNDWNDRQVHREGGKPIKWHKKGVHSMLRARWYIGEIRSTEGVWVKAHEAIVDRATFDRAQRAMQSRAIGGRTPGTDSRTFDWLMRGIANCSICNARMGAAYGPKGWQNVYYACAKKARGSGCEQPYAPVASVDDAAAGATVERLEALREILARQEPAKRARGEAGQVEKLRRSVATNRTRRERVLSMAIDGDISKDEMRTRVAKIDGELMRAEAKLADEETRLRPITKEARASALRDVETMRKGWKKMTTQERREVMLIVSERITISRGLVSFEWSRPESLCEASVANSLKLKTITSILNRLRKARV